MHQNLNKKNARLVVIVELDLVSPINDHLHFLFPELSTANFKISGSSAAC